MKPVWSLRKNRQRSESALQERIASRSNQSRLRGAPTGVCKCCMSASQARCPCKSGSPTGVYPCCRSAPQARCPCKSGSPTGVYPCCRSAPQARCPSKSGSPTGVYPCCRSAPQARCPCKSGSPTGVYPCCRSASQARCPCQSGSPAGVYPSCRSASQARCPCMSGSHPRWIFRLSASCSGIIPAYVVVTPIQHARVREQRNALAAHARQRPRRLSTWHSPGQLRYCATSIHGRCGG